MRSSNASGRREFGDDVIDAAIEVLARSGIGTYESPNGLAPIVPVQGMESPVRLLWDQVRAMALEAWSNGGILGEDLDALMPVDAELAEVLPAESPTIPASLVVAGYVSDVETEGARIARDLIGEQDWSEPGPIVFPQLALTLFTSDLARDRMAEAGVARAAPGAGVLALTAQVRTAQGDLCSSASGFINSALKRVFDALRLDESGGGSIFTTIVNFVVSVAETVVKAIVQAFAQPVLSLIAKVAGMVGVAVSIVSFVRPWSVRIEFAPSGLMKGVGGHSGMAGSVTTRIELGGLDDWPATLKSCAQLVGITLPNLRPGGRAGRVGAAHPGACGTGHPRRPGGRPGCPGRGEVGVHDQRGRGRGSVVPQPERRCPRQGHDPAPAARDAPPDRRGPAHRRPARHRPGCHPTVGRGRDQGDHERPRRPPLEAGEQPRERGVLDLGSPPPPDQGPTLPRIVWVHYDREAIGDVIQAGRILELVSCSGPYGDWSGTMLTGGIGPIPFSELPIKFDFSGASGVQTYTTETGGEIPWDLPGITSNVRFVLTFTVDGRTMRVRITGTVDERVQGQQLLGEVTETSEVVMPIEPAPDGVCPAEPTPTPKPHPGADRGDRAPGSQHTPAIHR